MQVTLITGAASGLGWQLARACHARGDALLLTDINAPGLEARAEELGHERLLAIAGDITDPTLHALLLQRCRECFGRLDLLINNAGITHRSPTTQTAMAVFRQVMAVDYHAPLELTLAALPLLRESRGQIAAIGSMAGWMPVLGRAGYCAAKSALSQFFEVLRGEIARLRAGRTATCGAIATQQRQAGISAVVVLGGLLEDADRMACDLAKALERSRIAGQTCESISLRVKGSD